MSSLFLVVETYTNGYFGGFLDLLCLISIVFGIVTIITKNPIVSVLFLIFLFSSVAIYLIMTGISFIGISYLLVYVGAVSILFIFILMLINIRISELLSDTANSIPLGIIITISFFYPIYQIISYNTYKIKNIDRIPKDISDIEYDNNFSYTIPKLFKNYNDITYVTGRNWDGTIAETTHITSLGNIMYTSYSLWLIITSIILLLAMVGAIVITIK